MLYHFDIALARHSPMSAREHLQTIEADSSGDALDLIAKQALTGQQGLETAWIRVVETWNDDGTPAKVRKVEVTIRPVAMDN